MKATLVSEVKRWLNEQAAQTMHVALRSPVARQRKFTPIANLWDFSFGGG